MKLSEITKGEFKRKLADPAAQDLIDRVTHLNKFFHPYTFELHGEDKESAMIEFLPPRMGDTMAEADPVSALKNLLRGSKYWVWDTWEGDVESHANAYVIRK